MLRPPGRPEGALTINRYVRVFAGFFILASLALGVDASPLFVSRWFLAFTAFVGANLLQSGLTGFCPLEHILGALGARRRELARGAVERGR